MLAAINRYSDQRKKDHAKEKGNKDFAEYVPIQFLHLPAKEINNDERFCEEYTNKSSYMVTSSFSATEFSEPLFIIPVPGKTGYHKNEKGD